MPSLITKNGVLRYRGSVPLPWDQTKRVQKLFPDGKKESYVAALQWEDMTRKQLQAQGPEGLSPRRQAPLTLIRWRDEYMADAEGRFSKKTMEEKNHVFSLLLKKFPLNPLMAHFTIEHASAHLIDEFKWRSGYAANKSRKNLARAWDWGVRHLPDFPQINPFRLVDPFPEERSPRHIPTVEDFWRLYDGAFQETLAGQQDRAILLTFFQTAARRGEVWRLKRSDLDFSRGLIRLWTCKRKGGNLEADWLPMTGELSRALQVWWGEREKMETPDKEHLFVCLDESEFCRDHFGRPFQIRQYFVKTACKRVGILPTFNYHGIRHLTATMLYHAGYDVSFIQRVLRHQNPTTTERYLCTLGLENVRPGLEQVLTRNNVLHLEEHLLKSHRVSEKVS